MASIVAFYLDEPRKPPQNAPDIHVEQLPVSDAKDFEIQGYPEVGVAYVRHPVVASRLLPIGSYHPSIVFEKVNDALSMLTALGAATIELAYTTEVSSEVRTELELLFGLISFTGSTTKRDKLNILYTASGAGGEPRDLPKLIWVGEPGWRGVIEGRLHGGLREFGLTFTYDQRSGVDVDLAVAVRKFGLRAGGDFRKAHRVAFGIRGTFPELTSGASPRS